MISHHIPPGHAHCPTPKPRPQIFNMFVPAKCTSRVADLQEQLFSLFFLDSSIIALNRFLGQRMIVCASFPETAKIVSKNTHVWKRFCFSTPYYALPILRPTIHSSMCCSSFVSVALTCPLFLQIGNILRNSTFVF